LIPSDDATVSATAQEVVGKERNPYRKARLLYRFVTQRMKYSKSADNTDVAEAVKAGSGDSYSLAMVYTALLRASGIPARPVAGVLVYGDKQTIDHYWTEFYLPGFGWIPADPGLGAGARFDGFPSRSDAANYYFGNLDNQHITFTEGLVFVDKLDPGGKTAVRTRSFSLQNITEEASSGVKSYNSVWDDVRVVDWW
jgi:transglutaminase-like putative cysteine protease